MKNTYIGLVLLLLVVTIAAALGATAKPEYFSALQSVYGTAGTSCSTCHTSIPSLNSYGNKFAGVATHSSDPISALKSIGAPPGVVTPTPTPVPTNPPPTPTPTLPNKPAPDPSSGSVLNKIIVSPLKSFTVVNGSWIFKTDSQDQNGNPISVTINWTSSNTNVGIIDGNGSFTALKTGETTITAENGTVKGKAIVIVVPEHSNVDKENKDREHREDHEHDEDHEDLEQDED